MTEKEFVEAFKKRKIVLEMENDEINEKIFKKLDKNGFRWASGDILDYEKFEHKEDLKYLMYGRNWSGIRIGVLYIPTIEIYAFQDDVEFVRCSDIEWEEEFPKVEITTDGKNTIAKLIEHGEVVKEGTARLNSSDEFDFKTGASYAFARLFGLGLNDTEKVLVEEENEEQSKEFVLQPNDRVKVNICSGYYGHIKEVEDDTVVVEIEIEDGFKGDVTVYKEDVEFVYRAAIRFAKAGEYIMLTNRKFGCTRRRGNVLEVGTKLEVVRGEDFYNSCKAKVLNKELMCYLDSCASDYVVLEGYDPERFPDA